ncbi:fat storage-inducing transmembrane protein 1 [Sphaerodactylus townsendi]|uniref:Fat storage-inducing transmembrane protein 1 n=1 Tax=Sphaerodactylus townsendi TaxID=933632 RepID=A0ACB8EX99_9SAUR|nr:fat storage-inducing transmembrane protein 1 [Sphaerodactylus townsendi]
MAEGPGAKKASSRLATVAGWAQAFCRGLVHFCSNQLAWLLGVPCLRRAYHLWLAAVVIFGPLLQFYVNPRAIFANHHNFFNIKFVRSAWGWTCIFLGGFMLLVVYLASQRLLLTVRHLSRLAVGAGLWLGALETFLLIENLTGYCFDSVPEGILVNKLPDKRACLRKGHQWHGYDVSGHTFLLTFCCLLIVEETSVFRRYLAQGYPAGVPLRLIFLLNVLLLGLWNFLLACTVVYLYEYSHKVVGAAIATLCWYLTYRVWYRYSWSPGRPGAGLFLKAAPEEAKKRN